MRLWRCYSNSYMLLSKIFHYYEIVSFYYGGPINCKFMQSQDFTRKFVKKKSWDIYTWHSRICAVLQF